MLKKRRVFFRSFCKGFLAGPFAISGEGKEDMKLVKLSCIALSAATVALAFAAGTAGATVLCAKAASPCSEDFSAGTNISMSIRSETLAEMTMTGGSGLAACSGTTITGTTSNTGGSGAAVKMASGEWEFNCLTKTKLTKSGEFEFSHIAGTDDATVVARNYEIEIETFFGPCIYGPGSGTHIGTLEGGMGASMEVDGILLKIGGAALCPSHVRWLAEYIVTAPNPLYVASQ